MAKQLGSYHEAFAQPTLWSVKGDKAALDPARSHAIYAPPKPTMFATFARSRLLSTGRWLRSGTLCAALLLARVLTHHTRTWSADPCATSPPPHRGHGWRWGSRAVTRQRHDAHRTKAGNSGAGLDNLFERLEPRQLLSQRCKEEDAELSPLPFGFRDGEIRLPCGADSTHSPQHLLHLLRLLRRHALRSHHLSSFDRLPSWSGAGRWAA